MRPLLALLLLAPCALRAQLPEHVPTNGLVAWYDFAGSLNDISGNENHGVSSTPPSLLFDLELNQSVASFDGINDLITVAAPAQLGNAPQISFAAWLKPSTGQSGQVVSMDSGRLSWFLNSAASNYDVVTGTSWASEDPLFGVDNAPFNHPEGWFHFGFAMTGDSLHIYLNGALLESASCPVPTLLETNIIIGYRNMYSTGNYHYEGMMTNLGCWNRPLSAGEFNSIYGSSLPMFGCTDETACNFDPQATTDDDSCDYGCNYCGEGTTWDTLTSTCIIANPTDVDLDGCTGVSDILQVLSFYNLCINEDGTSIDDSTATSIPESYYNDPDVLLLLDFNGNAIDASPSNRDITLNSYQLGTDRFGNEASALAPLATMPAYVEGSCYDAVYNANPATNTVQLSPPILIAEDDNENYSVSMWLEHPGLQFTSGCYQSTWSTLLYGVVPIAYVPPGNATLCHYEARLNVGLDNWGWEGQACPYSNTSLSLGYVGGSAGAAGAYWSNDTCFDATTPPESIPGYPFNSGWNHLAMVKSGNSIFIHVNGELEWTEDLGDDIAAPLIEYENYGALGQPNTIISKHDIFVELIRGIKEYVGQSTKYYALDDVIILNRALSEEEIDALYSPGSNPSVQGCTACDACNYNGLATTDDGSCDYSCYGCLNALACNYDALATFTDNSCYFPGDTCSDGNPLTCGDVYNASCQCEGIIPVDSTGTGPCEGLSSINYFGHDYALTEICGQCWMAENLRTSQFTNGDAIPTVCGTGNNSTSCSGTGFSLTIPDYGGQYNYWAYTDDRGLCPSGFHVPSLDEWQDLHAAVMTDLPEGETVANALRGPIDDFPGWTGTDLFGFSAIPAGSNCHTGNLGTFAEFATSTVVESATWNAVNGIYLNDYGSGLGGVTGGVHNGWCRNVSVRCVKD